MNNQEIAEILYENASIARRTLAAIVDTLILLIILGGPLMIYLNHQIDIDNLNSMRFDERQDYILQKMKSRGLDLRVTIVIIIDSLLVLLYYMATESLYGQTLGKMITGIAVVDINKKKIGIFQAFVRNLPKALLFFLMSPLGFIMLIDHFAALFDDRGMRIFDRFASTLVVYEYVLNREKENRSAEYIHLGGSK